ncbi:MAG: hypothetical protein U5Q16_06470 [Gammaproteobacteria bacterium]|nr:hypothetical protein [Gammaproteobacteria bacterium]
MGQYRITIFENDTISDYAAWATAEDTPVTLRAYAGGVSGDGNVLLTQTGNVLGDLAIQARDATITENSTITDGDAWNTLGGTTTLNPGTSGNRGVALDNLSNQLGALVVTGNPSDVLITDNTDLTQGAAWTIGAAPVTVDARAHAIDLSHAGNVFGDLAVVTENGVPSSLSVRENDAITQPGPWALLGVPVTLHAENDAAITVADSANQLGDLTVTGGVVTIRENDAITQGDAWTTTGTTSLDATDNAITLDALANVLGDLALANTSDADITEDDDITQAGSWSLADAAIELNAQTHDVLLTEATNVLGGLTVAGANAHIVENDLISDAAGWNVPGLTTLAADTHDIVLDANPAGNLGTVAVASAGNAEIRDVDGLVFDTSTVAGRLAVQAGGEVTRWRDSTAGTPVASEWRWLCHPCEYR